MILDAEFIDSYRRTPVNWGFPSGPNSLGELVYRRTYRRGDESWVDTLARVTGGVFEILEDHCRRFTLPFDLDVARREARSFFDGMFNFRWLPPGRGLWMMGTDFVRLRGSMALQNCAFVSTDNLAEELDKPFRFLMDVSMLGTGCGFDTRGAGKVRWSPSASVIVNHAVADSREGWIDSVGMLLRWGFGVGPEPTYRYHLVRPRGSVIKGFGGVSEGPDALRHLHDSLRSLILWRAGRMVTSRDIVDVMNLIGVCVVAGNVRRTAEIALGDPDDASFLDLKDYAKNPDREAYGWTSNNSVLAKVGMDYSGMAGRTEANGEPGYGWLENMRAYGRMCDPPDYRDRRVVGMNPCGEQSLESYEVCTLVETFPCHNASLDDYRVSLKHAFLYAKAVTLLPTHWKETNAVVMRNRRVGTSVSGVAQFVTRRGKDTLFGWLDEGYRTLSRYDRVYSEWLGVRESIKRTSVKPSGTVSLLANASPGVHYPIRRDYIRRVRYSDHHPDLPAVKEAGYHTEPDAFSPGTTVVEFPVRGDHDVPTQEEVGLREKVQLAADLQYVWADNQVSCTTDFDPETEGKLIGPLLSEFDKRLKSISFLPRAESGAYAQMPYESITAEQYLEKTRGLKPIRWPDLDSHAADDKYCDGQSCEITPVAK